MKKIALTLTLTLTLALTSAFSQDCANPINQATFQAQFNQVAVMPNNEAKLQKAMGFLNGTCMLSAQVKQMSQLFTDDVTRLDYCKAAYTHTFDRAGYYEVYDAFSKFSVVMRLHDHVLAVRAGDQKGQQQGGGGRGGNDQGGGRGGQNSNVEVVFPNLTYPSPDNYQGKKGCAGPVIAAETFKTIAQNVFRQPTDESKYIAIQTAAEQYCLSFGQVMKLTSLIQQDTYKHKALVNTFYMVYDQESYEFGKMLLATEALRNDWIAYCKAFLTPPPPVCLVNDNDFKGIMKDFEKARFTDDKLKLFKTVSKDRCFSTEQVKAISKQFPFGSEKMTVFKDSYAKCTDRNNYYRLVDELAFTSEKDELRNFIKNN